MKKTEKRKVNEVCAVAKRAKVSAVHTIETAVISDNRWQRIASRIIEVTDVVLWRKEGGKVGSEAGGGEGVWFTLRIETLAGSDNRKRADLRDHPRDPKR